MSTQLRAVICALIILLMAGCGGGSDHAAPSTATIGGTVTGLVGKLVLQNNAGDNLSVMANGAFTFATPLNNGATYAVTVVTQPAGPTCVVANGSGTATANVTSVSVTCTTDPSTVFLPMSATVVPDSATPGATGLFVISSKSPGDPPIQITADVVSSLGLQTQNAVSAQGTVSAGNPYALLYITVNSTGDNHVWSLNLSGTSTLLPTQLSNLAIPYYTKTVTSHNSPPVTVPVLVCRQRVIQKNLADPSSTLVILALPTDATNLCGRDRWVLIHASDGPTTDPVNLPTLSYPILPLYRPDGTLAGLVATDASNNLNFYADETFSNPRLLLANVQFYTLAQEGRAGPSFGMPVNPTYSFLLVSGGSVARGAAAVYRIDYSGTISADLYDLFFGVSVLVDSGNLYFTANTFGTSSGTAGETVGRIPGDGGSAQILQSMPLTGVNSAPTLIGISGSNLVLDGNTVTVSQTQPYVAQSQSYVATVPTSAPGTLETIATNVGIPFISLVGSDIFVNWADFDSTNFDEKDSTEILDSNGNVLQGNTPSSSFISSAGPVIQVTNITDPFFLGGGSVSVLDLSQPSSPTPVALKTTAGMAFNFPSGTGHVSFNPVTSTIGVADGSAVKGQNLQPAWVYDLAKGVIVPISMPNSTFSFLTDGL
jgi:hypothetical protein